MRLVQILVAELVNVREGMEESLEKFLVFLLAMRPVLVDSLLELPELEPGPRVKGEVDPVFSVYKDHPLEHGFGGTREVDNSNSCGGLLGTAECDRAC
jgi:hypothetical protein